MTTFDHSQEEAALLQLAHQSLLRESQFVVAVRVKGAPHQLSVKVFVDDDEGLSIDAAARVSRALAERIEEQALFAGKYTLEVGSPGLDMPLSSPRQYRKNVGRTLKIKTTEGKELEAALTAATEDRLKLQKQAKGKQPAQDLEINIEDIDKAYVTVSF